MSRVAAMLAPAKVNLFLRVFDRRLDGYHELETLFQAIDLADEVRVERGGGSVELEVRGADLGPVEDNLAHRAAARLLGETRISEGVRITLTKRIPAGAGLGGGSSDAAAALRCVALLFEISSEDTLMRRIAAELGSDVPFFLCGSPLAAGRGRGEVLEPFEHLPEAHLVLVMPPVHVSTAWAYHALDDARRKHRESGGRRLRGQPRSWEDVAGDAHNDFQDVVAEQHPEVARSLAALEGAGAGLAVMSGSGAASIGLFPDRAATERAAETLSAELGWACTAVRTLTGLPVAILE
jgi:4-diphosphocytidyl-2-C-methyl-D-erythritol kinase